MARVYSLTTIKALFGEASSCAHPDCHEPLKHHRAVDRHERAYSVAELENWKQAQRANAGDGTKLSDADLRAYRTLTAEEDRALADVARLAPRVVAECQAGRDAVTQVRSDADAAQIASTEGFGPVLVTDERGRRRPLEAREIGLQGVELQKWRNKEREVANAHRQRGGAAGRSLDEELAVLLMYAPELSRATGYLSRTAATAPRYIEHSQPILVQAIEALKGAIAQLWRAATGAASDESASDQSP
jgi:hypothetical protein